MDVLVFFMDSADLSSAYLGGHRTSQQGAVADVGKMHFSAATHAEVKDSMCPLFSPDTST